MPKSKKRQRKNEKGRRRPTRSAGCVLHRSRPPFNHYDEWFSADDVASVTQRSTQEMECEDAGVLETLISLGPIYEGVVPAAALKLHDQIDEGVIRLAIDGQPSLYTELSVAAVVGALVPVDTVDDAALHLHFMHANGLFVLDDTDIVNLALAPTLSAHGTWELNGHPETWSRNDTGQHRFPLDRVGREAMFPAAGAWSR